MRREVPAILNILVQAQTPMLKQYFQAKEAHPGVLIAMRVGDFYEFYGEDAEVAAKELEITLTGREDGKNGRIPMSGVPFHSIEKYLAALVKKGFKVGLCDQVEDPKKAKGLVRREVTRVLTSGTIIEDSMLQAGANNFLAGLCIQDGKAALATLDPSTGEFMVTEVLEARPGEKILQELARLMPSELLVTDGESGLTDTVSDGLGISISTQDQVNIRKSRKKLLDHFSVENLAGFGIEDRIPSISAVAMVLTYAESNGLTLGHVDSIQDYSVDEFMKLDPSTRRSLELTQNLRDGSKENSLLSVLDETETPMGARLLKRWIEQPLLDTEEIRKRQSAIEKLSTNILVREDLRESLKQVGDIERLVGRCSTGTASPRDVSALRKSLEILPKIDNPFRKVAVGYLKEIRDMLDLHEELTFILKKAIVADAPLTTREGGIFQAEYDMELDKLREMSKDGKTYIAGLEQKEREATGIDKLKVGYNSVFGYYLEISRINSDKVPDHYIRKQTLANAERFITAELKEYESTVLTAQEKSVTLEADLFDRLKHKIASYASSLIKSAQALAHVDVLLSLTEVALKNGYCKPEIVEEDCLEFESGKHPVVDATTQGFVPNDLALGNPRRLIVLTGPNMSGKSTYLRQAALIALMAQIGSYVPASSCKMGLCDRIFTRIGAKDEIALGQSTFMVEMIESANILNNSTERSLVILDEVGRGTSTYDGLAIAWSMVEYLAGKGAKTLFATHYHQLNTIADQVDSVENFRVSVKEIGDEIVWTHKVLPGGADRSYGLQVAKMAGVPKKVLNRAEQVLASLEGTESEVQVPASIDKVQMTLFDAEPHPLVQELEQLDVQSMTPIEALLKLDEWKKKG